MEWYWPEKVDLPGYKPNVKGHPRQIKDAARLINEARRPVIYAGGGIMNSGASRALRELAELTGIPAVTTLMGRGALPDGHPLCLGMPGMHGNYTAVTSMQKADLLVTLGARFDDRVTGKVSTFAPDAKIIHVDIDPAELGKVRFADVPIVGDVRTVIEELIKAVKAEHARTDPPDIAPWIAQIRDWQDRYPLKYTQEEGGPLKPQFVIERLRDNTPDDCILVAGVGQHQMWASQLWKFKLPNTWVNSGGLGTMGYAVPAAVGAKVGRPDRMVWAIDGDGCFQMTAQELVTAASERIPVKIAILNNAYLGMVRQWQELFYKERYSQVYLSYDTPDYVKLAEAYGCVGLRAEHADEVDTVIEKALSITDRSVVIDFRVDSNEMCFPMVPAGASNDDIITGPEGLKRADDPAEAPIA
jgi:acetolactate synthase-1/2/3 large subunit